MLTQTSRRAETRRLAADIRKKIIEMSASPNGVHIGGSISIADVLAVLYGQVLRNPSAGGEPRDRDYFVLSKGHASAALYWKSRSRRGFGEVFTAEPCTVST